MTFDVRRGNLYLGGELVTDVRKVFITREVAEELGYTPTYLIKFAKKIGLDVTEMREAGSRNYLFSEEGVAKLKAYAKTQKK